jgi:rhamnose utilization protein RhaD (predicted bifunctional aldolase and dehydrogenase)
MDTNIKDLIEISRFYGTDPDFVVAGGGNTSSKNDQYVYIKASGFALKDITEEGFVALERKKVREVLSKQYSSDQLKREIEVKDDLLAARVDQLKGGRPSVETSLHEMINYRFVVHTHPYMINSLLCSVNAAAEVVRLFGDTVLYVPYTDPGYTIAVKVAEEISNYRQKFKADPKVILLQNHGIFTSADSIKEIKEINDQVVKKISDCFGKRLPISDLPILPSSKEILAAVKTNFSDKVVGLRNNTLIAGFYGNQAAFSQVALPFTPDHIVYCKVSPLYIEDSDPQRIGNLVKDGLAGYQKKFGYPPKLVLVKDTGLIGIEENEKSVETVLEVFEDLMKISFYTTNFGGPHFLEKRDIQFIDNWEVENYRRKVAKFG